MWIPVLLLPMALLVMCQSQGIDETRIPNSSGSDVVEAVVGIIRSKCIFSYDRLFLRRLAYVESRDGLDPATYRLDYDGGIWQVGEHMLQATITCSQSIGTTCSTIRSQFGIEWRNVTWSDLRKPLYSGLAASLYIMLQLGGNESGMAGDLKGQEYFWSHSYHQLPVPGKNFTLLAAEATTYDCNVLMDIAFILDSSGSIGDGDFSLSVNFVAHVVEAMDVPKVVRVSLMLFETNPYIKFGFENRTKSEVITAITSTVRTTGGTNTNSALDLARTSIFTTSPPNAKRVAVLLTDGSSNDFTMTSNAARNLRDKGVTVYAVGIGSYVMTELQAIGSEPPCSHVFTLTDFSAINSILTEIQKATCTARVTMAANTTYTGNSNATIAAPVPGKNETVEISVTCGIVDAYVSYTNPKPSPAMYSETYSASHGRPAYLVTQTNVTGRPAYITVLGTKLPDSVAGLINCTDFQYSLSVIDKKNIVFVNPCIQSALEAGKTIHAYPDDKTKFVHCDFLGKAHITECLYRQVFNPATLTCEYETSGAIERTPLHNSNVNPCKIGHFQNKDLFHEYKHNPSMFIQCDVSGVPWLQTCPEGELWNQAKLECASKAKETIKFTNPCNQSALEIGKTIHAFPDDKSKFVQCDFLGKAHITECLYRQVFNPDTLACEYETSSDDTPLHNSNVNPCTAGHFQNKDLFHEYKSNPSMFIHCDAHGVPWLKSCPEGEMWIQTKLGCGVQTKSGSGQAEGPFFALVMCLSCALLLFIN